MFDIISRYMYELMVIGTLEGASALFEKVEKFLNEAEVFNLKSERLGKKLLAYPIAKQTEAEYFLFNFDAPGSAVLQISNKLRLEQETVLRYLLIKAKVSKEAKVLRVTKEEEGETVKSKPKVIVTTKPSSVKVKTAVSSKKVKKTIKSTKKGKK